MTSTINCEFCGKQLEQRYLTLMQRRVNAGFFSCDCEGAQNDWIIKLAKEKAREEAEKAKKVEARLRKAGIPEIYLNAQHRQAPDMAGSIANGKGYYIYGPQGSGKTYLAYAVARLCIENGMTTICTPSVTLMDAYRTRTSNTPDMTKKLTSCGLLLIDDLGKEASSTGFACERLFEIIDVRRGAGKPLIVTSNYSLGEIARKITEGDVGKSIASRFHDTVHRLRIDGVDRRLRD